MAVLLTVCEYFRVQRLRIAIFTPILYSVDYYSGGKPNNINIILAYTSLKSIFTGYNSVADNTQYNTSFAYPLLAPKSAKSRKIPRKLQHIAVHKHPKSSTLVPKENKKAQLTLSNPRDVKACQNCSNSTCFVSFH